ncbi:dihydrodipicolinate synthase family protein [Oricola sp.]|uniref:dihydrodipicolinate synthase family protein n=1 Tax=Oricola sp. TaxID=1979950 RepID=UPI0025D1717B|nr:dihydrodipicolinate synthase family protein [Oricola sp.]MCI5076604.1 dihydrodipicolinate synthase family protein [Oricola sp.]
MDRNSIGWTGVMPALTTPFTADGGIDHPALIANIERLIDAGCTGVIPVGCTGEFWSLTHAEKIAIYKTTADVLGDKAWKIVGAAAITAVEVIELAGHAEAAGCDGILVTPPYFAHLTDDEIYEHFKAVDAGVNLPVVLYNIPGNAGNALKPKLVERLATLEKVVAIKESSGDWANFQRTLYGVSDQIRVFCGPSSTIGVPAMLAGCDGLIDCFPNVWNGCIEMWPTLQAGKIDEAWALQKFGVELTDMFTRSGRTLYPATKAAMDHLGIPGGGAPRAPLKAMEGSALVEFQKELDDFLQSEKPIA